VAFYCLHFKAMRVERGDDMLVYSAAMKMCKQEVVNMKKGAIGPFLVLCANKEHARSKWELSR